MELESTIRLVNNAYHAEINLAEDGFTPEESAAVSRFGEPTVSTGGEFDDGAGLTFTLADEDRSFPSQFPVKQIFSLSDYLSDANDRALLWKLTVRNRAEAAIEAIRTKTVGTTGRSVENIDTTPA